MSRTKIALLAAILQVAGSSSPCIGETPSPTRWPALVTVTAQRNLDFADVFPGVNVAITITDLTSGKYLVTGDAGVDVDLTFPALPATLSDGGNTIPIVYAATDAAYHTSDDPGSATTFDPAVGATATLSGTGELYVWIGGTVQPLESAIAGSYSGTITMDAVYN